MKYQTGSTGRVVVAKFEDNDNILQGLAEIAKNENIRAGVVYLIGGMKGGRFVVGPDKEEMPPVPVWRELTESHEIVGLGTIFWHGDEPKIHFHGAYAKKDSVKAGCMRENAQTFLVLEAIIIEITGVTAARELDPVSGMVLLKV
ncbi:MAG: DNA-binding protein [Nitrospirae bacterium]|nr:MAG: DNA-binding protein [Nitrospirota bacterium]